MAAHPTAPSNRINYHKQKQAINVTPENFASELLDAINQWDDENKEALEEETKRIAKWGATQLRDTAPHRTGAYAGDMAVKQVKKDGWTTATIFNRKHYQLTHLLEKGHKNRDGGDSAKFPHWEPVEQACIEALEESVKNIVGG